MPTKTHNDEVIWEYYGIDPKTLEVECVTQTRGGLLSMSNADDDYITHQVPAGQAADEVVLIFKLTDIIGLPASERGNFNHPSVQRLKEKAASLKAVDFPGHP